MKNDSLHHTIVFKHHSHMLGSIQSGSARILPKKAQEGKTKKQVINAVRNKLLYGIAAVVKRGT